MLRFLPRLAGKEVRFFGCLALALGFALSPFDLQAQEDARAIAIRWAAVARARGYQIQVRTEGGRITHDRRLRNTVFEPRLEPGTYFYRIAAIGKAGKPGKFSPWLRVNVLPTRTPEIGKIVPRENTARGKRIEISGEGFQNESKAFLVRPNGARVALPVDLVNENNLSVYVTAALLGDGDYDIVVENPRGLKKEREEAIQIQGGQVQVDRSAQRGASRRIAPDEVVPAPDPREKLNALWRSALVPGWGQFYQGRFNTAVGVVATQTGLMRSFSIRSRDARRAGQHLHRRSLQNFFTQRWSTFNVRDDFFFWMRLSESRTAQFDASFALMQANTSGSATAIFYLWNLMDVALYSGQGEDSVGQGGALWRSALLPGWGQYKSGRPLAGAVFSGAFLTVGAGAVSHGLAMGEMRKISARNNDVRTWTAHYLQGRDIGTKVAALGFRDAAIERRRITRWKNELEAAGGLMGAIYLTNLADLFIPWEALGGFGGGGGENASLYIGPGSDGSTALGLTLRF